VRRARCLRKVQIHQSRKYICPGCTVVYALDLGNESRRACSQHNQVDYSRLENEEMAKDELNYQTLLYKLTYPNHKVKTRAISPLFEVCCIFKVGWSPRVV
jgi:hypothetical protein